MNNEVSFKVGKEQLLNLDRIIIDDLLKQIEKLEKENNRLKNDYAKIVQDNCYTLELEKRIDTAIKYIEQEKEEFTEVELECQEYKYDYVLVYPLLKILKGENDE